MMHTVPLLGLRFADFAPDEAVEWALAHPPGAPFEYVVTPNADHLVRLAREPALKSIYQQAVLRLLNSRVVARAARVFGLAAPRVVTGSDLTRLLIRELPAAESITIIGLRAAWESRLRQRTGLTAIWHYDPPKGFEHDAAELAEAVQFVIDHPSRFILLAVGSPRQERLAAAIAASGQATGLGLCVGASLEFLAGVVPRAPQWVQAAGLEWLHRLLRDPRRLASRYLVRDPAIFPLLLRERAGQTGSMALR